MDSGSTRCEMVNNVADMCDFQSTTVPKTSKKSHWRSCVDEDIV